MYIADMVLCVQTLKLKAALQLRVVDLLSSRSYIANVITLHKGAKLHGFTSLLHVL
jgi:hypothetical protein